VPFDVFRILKCCAVAMLMLAASHGIGIAQTPHAIDLQGRAVAQFATGGARVVVLIFAATDCPISNRYVPEITKLDRELTAKGVAFWWVFPNPGDTLPAVRKHGEDFSIATPTVIDARQELVRMAHVAVTPEAAVFAVDNGSLREVYHGRIDDRYIAFGQERPQVAHHELEEVIQATLAGRPVPKPEAGPVGCSIIRVSLKP
jgi:DNA-binding transcriptional regulator YhcF (GntR family)